MFEQERQGCGDAFPPIVLIGSTSQSSAILVTHGVTLKISHQGESERDKSNPAWAVPWNPIGQVGTLGGFPSELPLRARPSFSPSSLSSFPCLSFLPFLPV